MRTPTPAQAANDLRTLARILADGRWTRAIAVATDEAAADLTGGGGGDGISRRAVGTHSDPTAGAALRRRHQSKPCKECEPRNVECWHHGFPTPTMFADAYSDLLHHLGATTDRSEHWASGKLQGLAMLVEAAHSSTWAATAIEAHRCLVLHDRTLPLPNNEAGRQLRKEAERRLRYCVVCEAPLLDTDRRSMCEADYWLWRDQANIRHLFTAQPEGDPGSDRAHFIAWMRKRIADPTHPDNHGITVLRPGSPLAPNAMPILHEAG